MSANEGYDPFDLTDITEDEFDRLEAQGEPVGVVPGPAPEMSLVDVTRDVHGTGLEYLVGSTTSGSRSLRVHVVHSSGLNLVGASNR